LTYLPARLRKLLTDRAGVTALEYGIIAGVLGLVLIGIFQKFGSKMSTLFSTIGGSI
jgi:Flp pilus assembly pilin Flp